MISEDDMRFAALYDPNKWRKYALSVALRETYWLVMHQGSATSRDVADAMDISVQNANSVLRRLHAKGYLKKCEGTAASGGIEHTYRVRVLNQGLRR